MTRVLPVRDMPNGWTVVTCKWDTVPDYPYAATAAGMDTNTKRQELDLDWSASSGKLVYPDFGDIHKARDPLPFNPDLPLILGWDTGGTAWTGTPACVISQVTALGQWLLYPPVVAPEKRTVGILEFAVEWVARELYEEYAAPYGRQLEHLHLVHFGDPAGNNKPPATLATSKGAEARSCYEIMRDGDSVHAGWDETTGREILEERAGTGWIVESGEVTVAKRLEVVKARLKMLIGGQPALIVDPDATYLLDAFQGGYSYPQRQDGRYELDPGKNWYSHGMNALEYAASRLSYANPDRFEEQSYRPQYGATSGAGTHRRRD